MEHLIMIIGFALAFIGAATLGVALVIHTINYWEGLF